MFSIRLHRPNLPASKIAEMKLISLLPFLAAAFAEPQKTGALKPPGAQPPIEHQIAAASAIARCITEINGKETRYRALEIWKGKIPGFSPKTPYVSLKTRMRELLGFVPMDHQEVIVFLLPSEIAIAQKQARHSLQPLELLPVKNGKILYAPDDPSVRTEISLESLKKKIVISSR